MMDMDSLPAELLSFGEAAAQHETGTDRIADAAAVPLGKGTPR